MPVLLRMRRVKRYEHVVGMLFRHVAFHLLIFERVRMWMIRVINLTYQTKTKRFYSESKASERSHAESIRLVASLLLVSTIVFIEKVTIVRSSAGEIAVSSNAITITCFPIARIRSIRAKDLSAKQSLPIIGDQLRRTSKESTGYTVVTLIVDLAAHISFVEHLRSIVPPPTPRQTRRSHLLWSTESLHRPATVSHVIQRTKSFMIDHILELVEISSRYTSSRPFAQA